jgi:DNA-binding LacI/PurR family transcriptional regulator
MKVNIIDIAQRASTSIATVSRVLNNSEKVRQATRKKILDIIEETGYKPKVRKNRITNICIVINERKAFFSSFLSEILNGISDTIMSLGYEQTIVFVNNPDPPESVLAMLRERRVDAAIVMFCSGKTDFCDVFLREKFPFLVLNSQGKKFNYIDTDNTTGIRNAMEYLYSLGHRKYLLMLQDMVQYDYLERKKAFDNFCETNNLGLQRSFSLKELKDPPFNTALESSYLLMRGLIKEGLKETVVFSCHDLGAMGVLRACHEQGLKVPGDVSVIGFDNQIDTPYYDPPLTTISQNLYKMGAESVYGLLTILNNRTGAGAKVQKLLPTELVIRKSSGPAPKTPA